MTWNWIYTISHWIYIYNFIFSFNQELSNLDTKQIRPIGYELVENVFNNVSKLWQSAPVLVVVVV